MGYAGGKAKQPSYDNIQDHSEAVRVEFDPRVISYRSILAHFVDQIADPTEPVECRQYRRVLLVHSAEQREIANEVLDGLRQRYKPLHKDVCIAVESAVSFTLAEEYHQKYLEKDASRRFK